MSRTCSAFEISAAGSDAPSCENKIETDPKIALLDSHLYRKPSLLMTIPDRENRSARVRNAIAAEPIVGGAAACLWRQRNE
jgi:hypothetical protein